MRTIGIKFRGNGLDSVPGLAIILQALKHRG